MSYVHRDEKGTTVVELLVILLIVGVLTTAMARFFVVHNRLSNVQEQVGFMQKNVRSAMEIIIRDVMNAGSGVPLGQGVEPLTPGDGLSGGPDSLVIMANFDSRYTTLYHDEGPDNSQHVMDATGFYVGGLMYIEDFNGGEFHTITAINLDTPKEDEIITAQPLSRTYYMDDTIVSPIERVSYSLNLNEPDHPKLMRTVAGAGSKILAGNIEDLQFSFILADGSETPQPGDMSSVRMVRVTMVARTETKDRDFSGDGYRRRTLESVVKPRNLDL